MKIRKLGTFGKCELGTLIVAAICIIAAIVTWILFPIIYPKMVKMNLIFKETSDEDLGYSAFMWANPPMDNVMKFYFFNISNYQEMLYYGEKPRLVETGPYAVTQSEKKKYVEFNADGTEVFYENYKTYQWNKEESCDGCSFDDLITIPNPTEVPAAADIMDKRFGMNKVGQTIVAIGLLLLGENPFVTHTVKEILFEGYNDNMLSMAHSKLMYALNGILNGGNPIITIPIPAIPKMGFMIGYNNTRDENYWIKTGKGDIDNIGKIVKWGNLAELPSEWWPDKYSRSIRGSDSGSFNKWHLKKEDKLEMFQSFMCRSFNKEYLEDNTVHDIPSMTFSTPYDDYDTTLELNRGFRYPNSEKVNYYPDWPSCPDKNSSNCDPTETVDCSMKQNLCHDCCSGSFVNGTYLVPPGIFPLVCYPGRLQPTPFAVMYSPPHFIYSPQEMVDSVVGLSPDPERHLPMLYDHEPYSGTVTQVRYRLQVSMPVQTSKTVPHNMQLPNSIVPLFWQSAHATLKDFTYNKLWLGFVFVPKLVDAIKYFLLVFGLLLVVTVFLMRVRRVKKNRRDSFSLLIGTEDKKEEMFQLN